MVTDSVALPEFRSVKHGQKAANEPRYGPGPMVMVIGRRHQPKAGHAARKARTARANAWAAELAPIVADVPASGVTGLKGIARALNERGVATPRGTGEWEPSQVWRLLARMCRRKPARVSVSGSARCPRIRGSSASRPEMSPRQRPLPPRSS
jgi:hypothetical protein